MKHRLLLVESAESTLFTMQDYFEARGFDVLRARTPVEAKAALLQPEIAVVLIEPSPEPADARGGLELIESARRLRPGTPVVLLAWDSTAALQAEGRRLGADVVLDRPCRLGDIADVVERLLSEPRRA